MFFPTLFDSPAARISAFVDFGNVFKDVDAFDADELRVSTGIALMGRAPVGPISISYAFPVRKGHDDELERLQFPYGGAVWRRAAEKPMTGPTNPAAKNPASSQSALPHAGQDRASSWATLNTPGPRP